MVDINVTVGLILSVFLLVYEISDPHAPFYDQVVRDVIQVVSSLLQWEPENIQVASSSKSAILTGTYSHTNQCQFLYTFLPTV